jgi:hypothetical protein
MLPAEMSEMFPCLLQKTTPKPVAPEFHFEAPLKFNLINPTRGGDEREGIPLNWECWEFVEEKGFEATFQLSMIFLYSCEGHFKSISFHCCRLMVR